MCEFSQMGETHEKTKESSEYLKFLTQQAVALQRTMNEIYKNGSHASIMPLKVASSQIVPASDSCLPVSSDANWLFFFFHSSCCSLLLQAWPASWNSSTLSTASSLSHSGNRQDMFWGLYAIRCTTWVSDSFLGLETSQASGLKSFMLYC